MALDKAIKSGKEHRKPYTGSKAIDRTCRNHGSCPWCIENRTHKFRDKHPRIEEDEEMPELDDFIINNSYDAWEDEFEKQMDAWDAYCASLISDEDTNDLKN